MFYTYVYLRESGEAYYVGKGLGARAYKGHCIPRPEDRELIQMFYFDTQEECWDTEIQLIEFFGRECDGGTLMNKSTGGPGGYTGVSPSEETRAKLSNGQIGELNHMFGRLGSDNPTSKHYRVICPNGEAIKIHGLSQFCREHNLDTATLCRTANGRLTHHKGYTAEKIDG